MEEGGREVGSGGSGQPGRQGSPAEGQRGGRRELRARDGSVSGVRGLSVSPQSWPCILPHARGWRGIWIAGSTSPDWTATSWG